MITPSFCSLPAASVNLQLASGQRLEPQHGLDGHRNRGVTGNEDERNERAA
jgi:hypothetical protein